MNRFILIGPFTKRNCMTAMKPWLLLGYRTTGTRHPGLKSAVCIDTYSHTTQLPAAPLPPIRLSSPCYLYFSATWTVFVLLCICCLLLFVFVVNYSGSVHVERYAGFMVIRIYFLPRAPGCDPCAMIRVVFIKDRLT